MCDIQSDLHMLYLSAMRYNVEKLSSSPFSYKLQMRRMLGVADDVAEELDFEAKRGTGSFNI